MVYWFIFKTDIAILNIFLKNWWTPASFCLFLLFSNTNFTEKTVGFSEIRTQIIIVECEHADHLTTTTAPNSYLGKSRVDHEQRDI